MSVTLVNGDEQESVSVYDRGFQYGDGLFETLQIVDGNPCFWPRHFRRLQKGCQRLALSSPDIALLETEMQRMCAGVAKGVLKIVLTRGVGKRGYVLPENAQTTRVLSLSAAPEYPSTYKTEGVVLTVCKTPLGINPALAGIKHLNRLEQVLARAEWNDPEISEGLMRDTEGHVIEGTMSNVFCVRNGNLVTPDISGCGVEGITRERVMETATDLGYPVVVKPLSLDDIKQSDEVFVCNSVIGLWPVRKLEERTWAPGVLTGKLIQSIAQNNE